MDGFRENPSEFDLPAGAEGAAADDIAAAIGTDERRMHVRAYNYWVSLLNGRDYPSIEDLEPANLTDFADNSVLLDFTSGRKVFCIVTKHVVSNCESVLRTTTARVRRIPSASGAC